MQKYENMIIEGRVVGIIENPFENKEIVGKITVK